MIHLIGGRGQLGSKIKFLIDSKNVQFDDEIFIYHTWQVIDKSEDIQKLEYDKFVNFVDNHIDEKIVFISTYSQKDNFYNYYKQLSESYLILNCKKCLIVRLPTIIGKGVIEKMRNDEIEPYGMMELITIEDASMGVIKSIDKINKGLSKVIKISGEKASAKLVYNIIHSDKDRT